MSTTIELKYFNTFWIKKMKNVVDEDPSAPTSPYSGIPRVYASDTTNDWYIEESRIRDKVSRALIDKDAIYSAEGNASITSTKSVIGQIIPFNGEYGISEDPFSFAVYGYRKYFTDRKRNVVLRLATNGSIVEISSYGMHDFFRDKLSATDGSGISIVEKIRGGYDVHTKNYVLSIQNTDNTYVTANFDEDVQGWTSFFNYEPAFMTSLNSSFYSFYNGKVYLHHSTEEGYGNFYGTIYNSDVTLVLNSQPSMVKTFKTINYEGASGWELESMISSASDASLPISPFVQATTLTELQDQVFSLNFKKKENKFFANLQQDLEVNLTPQAGEVLWGASVSGIKGFWSTIKMKLNNTTYSGVKRELFAVSSDTIESSY